MDPSAAAFELKLDALTEALSSDSEFWDQFAGSGTANLLTMLAVALLVAIKKLCERDSKCKSHIHCCCLDLDVRDKTSREPPVNTDEDGPSQV